MKPALTKVGSLFAGVGGFDLAFQRCGMETAWVVENDKQCQTVLRHHFPNAEVFGDVREVGGRDGIRCGERVSMDHGGGVPDIADGPGGETDILHLEDGNAKRERVLVPVSVICGGFPCQDYSVAGKRGGLVGDRGALWWEMHRIIADLRPTWVVGENVPGLLSSNKGQDFLAIITSLVQLGYGCTWAILDSQYFGVAQRRRRLFIVGHSGGVPRPEILALSEGMFGHPAPSRETGKEVASIPASGAGTSRTGNERTGHEMIVEQAVAHTVPNKYRGDPHEGTDTIVAPTVAFDARFRGDDGRGYEREPNVTHTPHVDATKPPNVAGGLAAIPRRLVPLETERLQGFPDNWTQVEYKGKPMADGPRYRMCGNAVTVNVVEWIAERIAAPL